MNGRGGKVKLVEYVDQKKRTKNEKRSLFLLIHLWCKLERLKYLALSFVSIFNWLMVFWLYFLNWSFTNPLFDWNWKERTEICSTVVKNNNIYSLFTMKMGMHKKEEAVFKKLYFFCLGCSCGINLWQY
jgi:hypothetical protein